MKRKCEEDSNVLLAIVTRSFCQHCETDTVEENIDRFILFKWRETTENTRQRNQRICRSFEKLIFPFSSWTLDIIFQWLQLTSSSMYKLLTTQVFSLNTMVKKSRQHFAGHSPAAQNNCMYTKRTCIFLLNGIKEICFIKTVFFRFLVYYLQFESEWQCMFYQQILRW